MQEVAPGILRSLEPRIGKANFKSVLKKQGYTLKQIKRATENLERFYKNHKSYDNLW